LSRVVTEFAADFARNGRGCLYHFPDLDRAHLLNLEPRRLLALPALHVDETHRRLVDESGEAVFLQGDTAWSILTGATYAEADQYLVDRAARGVNVIVVNLVEALFNGPVNQNGDLPFMVTDDFSTPNPAYFAHADAVLRRAEELGIYVLLAPAYLGFPDTDSGWYDAVLASGEAKMHDYGVYVGDRYKDLSNIIWLQGGDRNPDLAIEEVNAMVAGIKSTGDTHLHTAHALPDFSAAQQYGQPWLDLTNVYTYTPTYTRTRQEYTGHPTRPVFLLEDRYEGMGSTPTLRRAQKWWSMLSGSFGAIMGNDPIWRMGAGWLDEFDSVLARDMTRLGNFFRSVDWDELQPAFGNTLIVSGQGVEGSEDYVSASITDDRELALAYFPAARTVTMNLTQMKGPIAARWFDPTSGQYTSAVNVSTGQAVSFTTPGPNAAGESDWLLVLEGSPVLPIVRWINFEVDRPAPSVTVQFNEFVGDELDATDFEVVSLATGQRLDPALTTLIYDYDNHRAALALPSSVADGNYRVRLVGAGIQDRSGTAIATDSQLSFFVLAGDANRDRRVDFADLLIVAQNYAQSGRTFSQGNINYSADGRVSFDDLLLLAQHYGTNLFAASPVAKRITSKSRGQTDLLD
jgi:hypothetical protein